MTPDMTTEKCSPSDMQCSRCYGWIDTLFHSVRVNSDGEMVCEDCDTEVCCENCEEWIEKDDSSKGADGKDYCGSCWDENFVVCPHCNDTICITDAQEVDGESYCETCFNRYFTCCNDCNVIISLSQNDVRTDNEGTDYCCDCYYEHYTLCDDCGEETLNDDIVCYNGQYVCPQCAQNGEVWAPRGGGVSDATDLVGSSRHFGVELETDSCNDREDFSDDRAWGCKTDCSVEGMEFFSAILRGNGGLAAIDRICKFAKDNSWEVDYRCGYHLHLDIRGETEETRKAIIAAYRLTYEVWAALVDPERIHRSYCKPSRWDIVDLNGDGNNPRYANVRDLKDFCGCMDRYEWFNLYAYLAHNTFEVRLHQGSLNAQEIKNWIRCIPSLPTMQVESGA